jgi:hypothetical protein
MQLKKSAFISAPMVSRTPRAPSLCRMGYRLGWWLLEWEGILSEESEFGLWWGGMRPLIELLGELAVSEGHIWSVEWPGWWSLLRYGERADECLGSLRRLANSRAVWSHICIVYRGTSFIFLHLAWVEISNYLSLYRLAAVQRPQGLFLFLGNLLTWMMTKNSMFL